MLQETTTRIGTSYNRHKSYKEKSLVLEAVRCCSTVLHNSQPESFSCTKRSTSATTQAIFYLQHMRTSLSGRIRMSWFIQFQFCLIFFKALVFSVQCVLIPPPFFFTKKKKSKIAHFLYKFPSPRFFFFFANRCCDSNVFFSLTHPFCLLLFLFSFE